MWPKVLASSENCWNKISSMTFITFMKHKWGFEKIVLECYTVEKYSGLKKIATPWNKKAQEKSIWVKKSLNFMYLNKLCSLFQ